MEGRNGGSRRPPLAGCRRRPVVPPGRGHVGRSPAGSTPPVAVLWVARVPRYPRPGPAAARRCLDLGARGIKLHPRAEQFTLDHPAVGELFVLAEERGVPILTHAGRGIPALGRHVLEQAGRHPGANVILAHAGICDLAWIWRRAPDHPNVFYDTAWWNPADLVTLFSLVPPRQILYGSDAPYGRPFLSVTLAVRCGLQAGLSSEQMRGVLGGQLERLLAGE